MISNTDIIKHIFRVYVWIGGLTAVALGTDYYAVENLTTLDAEPRRGIVSDGVIPMGDVILAPQSDYRFWVYEGDTGLVGTAEFTTPRPGRSFNIPVPEMRLSQTRDSDSDGLSDEAEWIIGTNPTVMDTDEDQVEDGAEVAQGRDPLDGLNVRTGIILSRGIDGSAIDIAAFNDIIVLAKGDDGISVFNIFNTMEATIIAQINTPGFARSVAYPGGRRVAVADGPGGISIIDLAEGPNARTLARFPVDDLGGGEVRAIAATADLGIAGTTNGRLITFDMNAGILLDVRNIGGNIHDIAIRGSNIFVMRGDILRSYPLRETPGNHLDEVTLNTFGAEGVTHRRRLFVGNQFAYITSYPGYDVVDISDPSNMIHRGQAIDSGPNSFKQIVSDGTGTGIAAVGVNPSSPPEQHNISLYTVSDPDETDVFETEFSTPGLAHAVTLYNGLAYIADGEAGFQVLNYRGADFGDNSPTGSLLLSANGNTAVEGSVITVRADVTDDVQVRNVEFYANGQRFGTDGSFPYEIGYRVPQVEAGFVDFTAIARDKANNTSQFGPIRLNITEDTEPPSVQVLTNIENAIITDRNDIQVQLNITDHVSVRDGEVYFVLDGEVIEARRVGGDTFSIASPGIGHYQLSIRVFDGANNITTTTPVLLKVRAEAISREVSVLNHGRAYGDPPEAISREVSLFNFGRAYNDPPEAISREVSVNNESSE